ncbi:TM2 domain-containing protein [Oceanobacillus timonensis]|uniref:TM2 domain-containing protein n=1 Tax=Oceanobacillus timonensis TaxID=1926285 RepID=UPI001FE9B96E|nr:TM2 domain-containing protein [Oceanobacillus timonensis]
MPLSTQEKLYVNSEIERKGKNIVVAYLLAIFLGTLGIHRFYLGKVGSAVSMLILWIFGIITTFILIGGVVLFALGIWVIVDLFLIPGMIKQNHNQIEVEVTRNLENQKVQSQ